MKKNLLLFLMTLLTIVASADDNGYCGWNGSLTYTYVSANHTLTISGKGIMRDYDTNLSPWYDYRAEITTIIINDGVTYIGRRAFGDFSNLISVTIPNSVTSIGKYAFDKCISLTSITIPDGVKSIGDDAFYRCTSLTSITISNSLTSLGNYAFASCSSLATITLPNSLTSIGRFAFAWSGLTSVKLPNSLTVIQSYTFSDCKSLKSIEIPNSVKTIELWAFAGCDKVQSVSCSAENVPKTDKDAFKETPINRATLFVPSSSVEAYSQASLWKDFRYILPIGSESPVYKYKLTYMVDGKEYKSYEYEYGSVIIPEEPPVKEGYTFSGWSEIPNTMPDHDVTITGSFVVNKYKITYMIDDEVYKVVEYRFGEKVTPPSKPVGNYATFEWENLPSTMPAQDLVVHAKYTMKEPEPEPRGHKMILSFKNGDDIAFVLKDKPQISFSGNQFVLDSSTGTFEYLRSDIEDFRFEEIETSVESIEYRGEGDVTIYDMEGRLVATLRNESLSSAKMYLNSFKSGMYIIKIGNQQTIKYLKK